MLPPWALSCCCPVWLPWVARAQEACHHTQPLRLPGGDSHAGSKVEMGRTEGQSHFPDTEDRPGRWVRCPPQRRRLQGRPAQPRSPAPGRLQWHHAGPRHRHILTPSAHCATLPGDLHTHEGHQPDAAGGLDLCRPALRPRCGHSCSDPKGFGDSLSGPALHLRTPRHPSTRAPSLGQIWPLQGQPVPPHSPAAGRPPRRHAGPIHHHTPSPSARCATPPAGLRTRGGRQPDAASLGGWKKSCDISEALGPGAILKGATGWPAPSCWWGLQLLDAQESSGERPWSPQEVGGWLPR